MRLVRGCNKCPACHANQRTHPSALASTGNASDDGSETRASDNLSDGLFSFAASCGFGETCNYSIRCVAYFSRDDFGSSGPFNRSKLRRNLRVDKQLKLVFDLKNSGCRADVHHKARMQVSSDRSKKSQSGSSAGSLRK